MTSLDRVVERFKVEKDAWNTEWWLMREFQRRLHHYMASPPRLDDRLTLRAIMQHYGAPTRLHDWTFSPFVAAFIALEEATNKKDNDCLIFAIDMNWCKKWRNSLLPKRKRPYPITASYIPTTGTDDAITKFDKFFPMLSKKGKKRVRPRGVSKFVYPVNSFRLTDRQTVQQGTFLCAGDISCFFQSNLDEMKPPDAALQLWSVPLDCRQGMLADLQEMGVTRASLFPDLEGFAESLKTHWTLINPEKAARSV